MFPIEVFQATLTKLTTILESLRIRYHLTGGVTGTAYGEPRMTQDIDIVVDPSQLSSCLEDFLIRIKHVGFLYADAAVRLALERGEMFQLLDLEESLKLDIYPREMIPGELSRSNKIELFPNVFVPAVSRVDASISKLIWVSKGSHKSRRDFRALFRSSNEIDRAEIRRLSQQMHLGDLAQQVLDEPDEIR